MTTERETEALAEWLGEMPESRNVFDITDEATTVISIDVETLAERITARLTDHDARIVAEAEARRRDLVSRLGFGDGRSEPMADNDTIVAWFEERGCEADEWRESQRWRDECALAGHPDDEDCPEHDPILLAEARGAERVLTEIGRRVNEAVEAVRGGDLGTVLVATTNAYADACRALRAALADREEEA